MVARAKIGGIDGYSSDCSIEQSKIHQSRAFMASYLGISTYTTDFIVDLSANSTTQYHMRILYNDGSSILKKYALYKGSGYVDTTTNDSLVITNKHIASGVLPTTSARFFYGPTVITTGAYTASDMISLSNRAGFALGVDEIILQGGNVFLIKADLLSTTSGCFQFHWYETSDI